MLLPYILNNLDGGGAPASCARLLLETGDVLLLETGDFLLLEHSGTCGGAFELPTDVGTYAVTGSAADLITTGAYELPTEAGAYTVTGSTADLLVGRVLEGTLGSYALTGSAADLVVGRALSTEVGTYVITGSDAGLFVGRGLATEAGAYVVTGSPADLPVGRVLVTEAGSYTLTGFPATLVTVGVVELPTEPGAYVLTGSAADLVWTHVYTLPTEAGAYTVTGADALLAVGRLFATDAGVYVLTGAEAALLSGAMSTEAGSYLVSGVPAGLAYSAAPLTFVLESLLTRRMRRSAAIAEEDRWLFHHELQVDLETGVGIVSGQGSTPTVMLRWSDDGGETWSNEVHVSAGKLGEFSRRAIWRRLGRSRDRVYEVVVSDPVAWNLLGAFLKVEKGLH